MSKKPVFGYKGMVAATLSIGGLSMGGYGALRAALRYPDVFSSATSHSGALFHGSHDWTLKDDLGERRAFAQEMIHVFGARPEGSSHDLLALARSAQVAGLLPRMRIDCGVDSFPDGAGG